MKRLLAAIICFSPTLCFPTQVVRYADHDLPVASVTLPNWENKEFIDSGETGKIVVRPPNNNRWYVRVTWAPGSQTDRLTELSDFFRSKGGGLQLDGKYGKMELYRITPGNGSAPIAFSGKDCKESNRSVAVYTFLEEDWDSVKSIHETVYRSIRCKAKSNQAKTLLFPKLNPGDGYEKNIAEEGVFYRGTDGSNFSIIAGSAFMLKPDAGMNEFLTKKIVGSVVGSDLVFNELKTSIVGDDVQSVGEIEVRGSVKYIYARKWRCREKPYVYFGLYIGPKNLSLTPKKRILDNAGCELESAIVGQQ